MIEEKHNVEQMLAGKGPVALRLLECDRIENLKAAWRLKNGVSPRGVIKPSAQALIDWTRPYTSIAKIHDVIIILQKYFSFKILNEVKQEGKENKCVGYISTKQTVDYQFKSTKFGKYKDEKNYPNHWYLTIEQVCSSGTKVDIIIKPGLFAFQGAQWLYVVICDYLEQESYYGDVTNINIKEFEKAMDNYMAELGWDQDAYENAITPRLKDDLDSLLTLAPEYTEAKNYLGKEAIKHAVTQYTDENIGFCEYMDKDRLIWVFISKEYTCKYPNTGLMFTGSCFDDIVLVTEVNLLIEDYSSLVIKIRNQDTISREVIFDSVAKVHFFAQVAAAKRSFAKLY